MSEQHFGAISKGTSGGPAGGIVAEVDDTQLTLLQAYLRDRDVPCPACGYNLRDSKSDRCAECGEAVELRVGQVEKPLARLWTLGLIGLSASMGFSGLVLLYFVLVMIADGWSGPSLYERLVRHHLAALVISVILLCGWLWCRRPMERWRWYWVAIAVLMAWAAALANMVLFYRHTR